VHTNKDKENPNGKLQGDPKPKSMHGGGKGVRKESKRHYLLGHEIT
jgi:hypothetical protein